MLYVVSSSIPIAFTDPSFTLDPAAETHDVEKNAKSKLERKNLDMIAANQVGQEAGGFDSNRNALQVLWHGGQQELKMTEKTRLARQLLKLIVEKFYQLFVHID